MRHMNSFLCLKYSDISRDTQEKIESIGFVKTKNKRGI